MLFVLTLLYAGVLFLLIKIGIISPTGSGRCRR